MLPGPCDVRQVSGSGTLVGNKPQVQVWVERDHSV